MKAPKLSVESKLFDPLINHNHVTRLNTLSYTYKDDKGVEKIQKLKEFEIENEPYFAKAPKQSESDLRATIAWKKQLHSRFLFFSLPSRVLWNQFQTDIRSQADRNTCSAFGMVAAIEARYLRDFNLRLDLSEQFFWHCYKSTSLDTETYLYDNQSSYWGGGNSQGVVHASNFAIPIEEECPYLNRSAMNAIRNQIPEAGQLQWKSEPTENTVTQEEVDAFEYSTLYIPHKARQKAKYGIKSYQLLSRSEVQNTSTLKQYIAWGNEVIMDANLKWKTNGASGILEYDPDSAGAGHVFLVVGYDDHEQVFFVKNSWGESGFLKVSYEFAQNCFTSGSIVREVTPPNSPNVKERPLGRWDMNHDGWKGTLVIRRFTNIDNSVTRLGHYIGSDGIKKAVNGQYINENRGISFVITNAQDTAPTVEEGQRFNLNIFSWDIVQGAGETFWNSVPYGAYINRDNISSVTESNFTVNKWLGNWKMNHDGWKGELEITQVIPVTTIGFIARGSYKSANGTSIPISSFILKGLPHILEFSVRFTENNTQPFVLHFHSWSSDLASGYTTWNGTKFGAVAFKQ
ncbi:MAG: C1 family peptidase [Bacteroidota bacterium]